ncbi:5-aminolevulinate synthase [Hypoxylon trugodes]|uniref:5-aminolevulinate synthase n=1 Tax=Hypoxylon trugodes TaxID=326681 RepID=UPI0021975A96|nr:5-aminolevulinate synthase [Hypoxylon trugodes]KAI1388533.1 5-aminolevulinate synthase [Hypoxylon trugodes]
MSAIALLEAWMKEQKLKGPQMKNAPTFYRNLEEALDVRRTDHAMFTRTKSAWKFGDAVDFCSNDLLSLGATGKIREAFLNELAAHPNFELYAGGSRLMDGNYDYIEETEQQIANFHGAETALIVGSGYEGNGAIYMAIPRPGDAIVYDELVHASTHDGMASSLALVKVAFRHNDVDALREVLTSVIDSQPMIRDGSRSIIISLESVYSMDGDVCPLIEMIDVAKEVCPKRNVVFIVDEAHATGIIGPKGAGLVRALGVEKEIAVRLHTCGKALASTGAVILGKATVRAAVMNFARSIIYTTAPSFPTVAGIRAAYNMMMSGATEEAQKNIQHLVNHFFTTITSNDIWLKASEKGVLSIPIMDAWETQEFHTHIVPVWTRQRYNWWLVFHLQLSGISAFPIDYPTVPKGQSRIRLMFHAANTESQVEFLATTICNWAKEMIDIEEGTDNQGKIPKAAQQVYALMATAK